ncbi:MAG TPA: ATP-binding protein [Burkholderiaceae bacterium]|nr:ATP-binding protein [Burkholderiaceae bacterium]
MKLTKLRLSQIRQFRDVLEIGAFDPGLNVFWGPNEAGKSTVVRAIRAAFLERYRKERLDQMQRVLFNAAERHQVLLFTCHRERWTGLGAPARELRSFVTPVVGRSR